MKHYYYGMRLRGFSPGAQPKGVVKCLESKEFYNIIVYDRPLREEEEQHYDLTLIRISEAENEHRRTYK